VEQPQLLKRTSPVYPAFAKQAHIEGTVRMEALIDRQGRLRDIHVISGHPVLAQAALQAVKEWVYRPARLNGQVIEMNTQITLNFTLGQ
jgi:protein TonB